MKSKLIQKLSMMTPEKAYEFDLIMCDKITYIPFKIYSIGAIIKRYVLVLSFNTKYFQTTCRHTQ